MTLVYGSVYLSPKRDRGETMSHLQFAKGISRLGTESAFVVLSRAQKLAAEGHDIINLGIGQPDFRTPEHIVQAGIQALKTAIMGIRRPMGCRNYVRRWHKTCTAAMARQLVRTM